MPPTAQFKVNAHGDESRYATRAAAGSKLTINVTNAGAAKKGTVILWIR